MVVGVRTPDDRGGARALRIASANRVALANGVRSLGVRVTRNINRVVGRSGKLFPDRFHARALATPTETRNALRYVLLNGNRHEAEHTDVLWFGADAYSSGAWFDGWADERWQYEPASFVRPTVEPRTWLLRIGWWRAGGPIALDDTPGSNLISGAVSRVRSAPCPRGSPSKRSRSSSRGSGRRRASSSAGRA